jgi:hypothetical protein
MKTITHKFKRTALLFFLCFAWITVNAQEPSYGDGITVDGNISDWNLGSDFFANMYEAGNPEKDLLSKSYLRYNCNTNEIYILVLTEPGVSADISASDAWMKVYDLSNNTQVDGNSASFAWLPNNGGWEGSFQLAEANYAEVEIHLSATFDGESGRTSSTGKKAQDYTPLNIDCPDCIERIADAGEDQSACLLNEVQLNASANGPGEWSGGNGIFDDITKQDAKYIPDPSEENSVVTLRWTTAADGDCEAVFDEVEITVSGKSDTIITNETICSDDSFTWDVNGLTYEGSEGGVEVTVQGDDCSADKKLILTVNPLPTVEVLSKICTEGGLTYSVSFKSDGEVSSSEGQVDNDNQVVTGIPFDSNVILTTESNECSSEISVEAPIDCGGGDDDCIKYEVTDAANHSIWLNGFPCAGVQTNFTFTAENPGHLEKEGDNWRLTGEAIISSTGNCDEKLPDGPWSVDFVFVAKEGLDLKFEGKYDPNKGWDISDWTVDHVLSSGTITNSNGAQVNVMPMPNNLGLQFGTGASVKHDDFGASTWFNFEYRLDENSDFVMSNKHGDINVAIECIEREGDPRDPCENYAAFYVDNAQGASNGVLHGVSFIAGEAVFTELAVLDYPGHLSYDAQAGLIYVNNANGEFIDTYNSAGDYQGRVYLDEGLSNVINNVFNSRDGSIYLGSGSQNRIVKVNPADGSWTEFAWNLPLSGGDLVLRDGVLYLASRTGNKLYIVQAGDNQVTEVGGIPKDVNGIALSPDNDNFVMANKGENEEFVINPVDGSTVTSYPAVKNGAPFALFNGDLASGCSDNPGGGDPEECVNYAAFYANHNNDNKSKIYGVAFNGGNAEFTEITSRDYEVHLAFNYDDGYIYTVDADNPRLEQIDPFVGTGQFINLVKGDAGEPDINSVYCMVYYEGRVYLGSDQNNRVYKVEFIGGDAVYTTIAMNVPVQGGDLVVKNGRLYLATRAQDKLYLIAGGTAVDVGSVPEKVNGIALSEDNSFITTNFNSNVVYKLEDNGDVMETFTVTGDLTQLKNGDFASGCAANGFGDPFCSVGEFVNPDAEAVNIGQRFIQYYSDTVPEGFGWSTTTSIEVQTSGEVNGVISFDGEQHFELLSREIGDNMYQAVATTPLTTVYLSFYHKKRPGQAASDKMEVLAGEDVGSLDMLGTYEVVADEDWKQVVVAYDVPEGQTSTTFMLKGLSGSTKSIGNLIDGIAISCEDPRGDEPTSPRQMTTDYEVFNNVLISANSLRLYPVPTKTELNIKISEVSNDYVANYSIRSMTGQVTHTGVMNIKSGQRNVVTENVSNLPVGMYFLVMEVDGKQFTKQFAKVSN